MIPRIITFTCLMVFLLIPVAYAEYPTSTPMTMEPLNLIDGIIDAFDSITGSKSSTESGGGVESMAGGSSATVVRWTGLGDDELTSNPENWSGGLVPQNGDRVEYDGTSEKDSTWDMYVTLFSLEINSGYTGMVNIANTILTTGNFALWTGAEDNSALNPNNWAGGVRPQDGDNILFDGSSSADCTWNINITPKLFVLSTGYGGTVTLNEDLSMSGSLTVSSGVLALTDKALSVEGYLLINPEGTINGGSSIITLKGNWSNNSGTYIPGFSTVVLAGTNQTIYGSTTFYNLTKIVTAQDILYFKAGETQIVQNSLVLMGAEDNLLSLYSTDGGDYWYVNPLGAVTISYARIKDMNNNSPVNLIPWNSIDEGHNDDVSFGGSECVCIDDRIILSRVLCSDNRGAC
ncbi:MAG: hypothetical protein AB1499_15495 [Nitrospirota bacterium]